VNKNIFGTLFNSEIKGYYLAHYLKEKYGNYSVLTINQYCLIPQELENTHLAVSKCSDIFVYSKNIPLQNVHPMYFDGFILRNEIMTPSYNLRNIFSKNIIKTDIEKIKYFMKYFPGYAAKGYYNRALESLKFLTGEKFSNISEWEKWFAKIDYDGFKRLTSKYFSEQILDEFEHNHSSFELRFQLFNLGMDKRILDTNYILSKDYWENVVWPEKVKSIIYLNAIGIMWVGTAAEMQEAKDYLEKQTPGKFLFPQDYLQNYRKNHYNVNY